MGSLLDVTAAITRVRLSPNYLERVLDRSISVLSGAPSLLYVFKPHVKALPESVYGQYGGVADSRVIGTSVCHRAALTA
jgi:hypothetical protein